ncbi:hypothetical protein ACFE04_028659 [Oxalis oulophora]
MPRRRRLRLTTASDEDEEEYEVHIQTPANHEPVTISDDDFVDVSDNISPPSPPPGPTTITSAPPSISTGSPIGDILAGMGLRLKKEWLDSCVSGLEGSVTGFASFDLNTKAKLCFQQFLFSDMNSSGSGGVLPENVHTLNRIDLKGPFVLQVDEIVNISCPIRARYHDAPSGIQRCLKLSMTDGVQRVFGMEYRPINDLKVFSPAGLKVAVCNVHVRRGLLMLVPEAFEVLGGFVEELEAARERLVNEVNKPPRGKRTREGVGTPLSTRATHAAWPPNGINIQGNTNDPAHSTIPLQAREQVVNTVGSRTNNSQRNMETRAFPSGIQNSIPNRSSTSVPDAEEMQTDSVPVSRTNDLTSNLNSDSEMHVDTIPVYRTNSDCHFNTNSEVVSEDIDMVNDFEHPHVLSGDSENLFTYMASLSSKWASMNGRVPCVQGKIKCFLTGVKGFQYKDRTRYELQVYVDDGSLISEILIDHNVVEKGIGCSPGEVTAALSSLDKKISTNMKLTLKHFQKFLANFEGTMLVEMNKNCHLPVALEMSQGCSTSDAWLLLRRVKSLTAPQLPQRVPFECIDISP